MPDRVPGSIAFLAPLHLLTYASLLGTELYQTFVVTRLSYRALPLAQFRTLQKSLFPAYFGLQLLLVAAVALTHPPCSVVSLLARGAHEALPVGVVLVAAAANWGVYGPRALRAMIDQAHQETRDGRRYGDAVKSDEMKAVMRRFSKAHAMSIHINLVTIAATLWYGFVLASKLSYPSSRGLRK